jgi:hypothetical protein
VTPERGPVLESRDEEREGTRWISTRPGSSTTWTKVATTTAATSAIAAARRLAVGLTSAPPIGRKPSDSIEVDATADEVAPAIMAAPATVASVADARKD